MSANIYYEPWTEWEIEKGGNWPGLGPTKPGIPVGSCRRAFVVVEFAVKNEYPTEITVGRFMVAGWMFSDRYNTSRMLYPPKRDYRVFDLYTRAPISLESYVKLPPRGSYGLRIEVFEDTDGPAWKSNHSRYIVNLPRSYAVEFHTDVGTQQHKIKFPAAMQYRFEVVYHWSNELLPPPEYSTLPQGLQFPERRLSWRLTLHEWWNRILYGKTYHLPGDRNRFVRALRMIWRRYPLAQPQVTPEDDNVSKG